MPLRSLGQIPLALWVQATVVFVVVATLVLMGFSTALLLDSSHKAIQQRAEVTRQTRLIIECTTPPRLRKPPEHHVSPTDCYARQKAARGSLVGTLREALATVTPVSAACGAAHPGNIEATRSCVESALRQEQP